MSLFAVAAAVFVAFCIGFSLAFVALAAAKFEDERDSSHDSARLGRRE